MALSSVTWIGLLACRLLPAVLFVPAFGGARLPLPARIGLAMCLAWALMPVTLLAQEAPHGWACLALMAKELAVGIVLAFAANCAFDALRMAGGWLDNLAGTQRSQVSSAAGQGRGGPLSELHALLAVLVFFALGGPEQALAALADSLRLLPLGGFPDRSLLYFAGSMAIDLSNAAIRCAAALALPAGLAVVLTDGLLGLLNRSAPGLPVYFVGLPLRMSAVLAVVAIGMERLPDLWIGL